jgi:hypothetical protein
MTPSEQSGNRRNRGKIENPQNLYHIIMTV